jgi:hypothetical protein
MIDEPLPQSRALSRPCRIARNPSLADNDVETNLKALGQPKLRKRTALVSPPGAP